MKYRERPVVIEVSQWTGGPEQEDDPEWIIEAVRNGSAWFENEETPEAKFMIRMLEGVHGASIGDYIICGIAGEIYPCKSDIFLATYEPAATKVSMNVTTYLDENEIKHETDGLQFAISTRDYPGCYSYTQTRAWL